MTSINIAALVNLLGWTVGFALYAMLLAMALRLASGPRLGLHSLGLHSHDPHGEVGGHTPFNGKAPGRRSFDALPLATALLGLVWNAGELATYGLHELAGEFALAEGLFQPVLEAVSFAALGFLPAVVVHSAIQNLPSYPQQRRARLLTGAAYLLSTFAAAMHLFHGYVAGEAPSNAALQLLTFGFVLLMLNLFLLTRGEPGWRRAVWATALAVFAVSALHLAPASGSDHEAWYVELIGHHASLPLALAILYQDYRFAFADIFLKRALALVAFVALVAGAFSLYVSVIAPLLLLAPGGVDAAGTVGTDAGARHTVALLALWIITGLLYPRLQRATTWFVEKIVLQRYDYAQLRAEINRLAQHHENLESLLDDVCARLAPALSATAVRWRQSAHFDVKHDAPNLAPALHLAPATSITNPPTADAVRPADAPTSQHRVGDVGGVVVMPRRISSSEAQTSVRIEIPTTEAPGYRIDVGELAGGRRLLSDDTAMLEAVAIIVARRIDALRVTHERCEQVQREQQIAKLATEAQLRALRAQVNPHFLFNALTTIGYLIQTAPDRALETMLRLTDLLRRVLRATEEWVPLSEELKLVEAYLDIERTRFEERLRVRIDVPAELRELAVPSLLLQPVVENAIKHGIAPLRLGGEVIISARLLTNVTNQSGHTTGVAEPLTEHLCLSVQDTGAGASAAQLAEGRARGIGLANVEQRLRALCGETASFRIESQTGHGATVELRLPLHRRPSHATHTSTNDYPLSRTDNDASRTDGDAQVTTVAATTTTTINSSASAQRKIG